jgi:hypothetical protein
MELKWDHVCISKKDRKSLCRSIRRLGVNRAYFFATNTKSTSYKKITKRPFEKYRLFEVVIPLGLTGKDRGVWQAKRKRYRSNMAVGKRFAA